MEHNKLIQKLISYLERSEMKGVIYKERNNDLKTS